MFPFDGLHKLVLQILGCHYLLFGFIVSIVKRGVATSFGLGSYRDKVDFILVRKLLIKPVGSDRNLAFLSCKYKAFLVNQ